MTFTRLSFLLFESVVSLKAISKPNDKLLMFAETRDQIFFNLSISLKTRIKSLRNDKGNFNTKCTDIA